MLKWLARRLHRFGHALEIRGFLVSEYLRARQGNPRISAGNLLGILRYPSRHEDPLNIARFISAEGPVLLVDVGGNTGDWAKLFCEYFPVTTVLAFEPDPRARAAYERRFAGDPHCRVVACAVSDHSGQAEFALADNTLYSTLEGYEAASAEGHATNDRSLVELVTLDSQSIDTTGYAFRLLKIDVQGHELAVLHGAMHLLGKIDAVLVELSFVQQYVGQLPSSVDVTRLLGDAGLYPAIFQHHGHTASPYAWERDVLFVREPLLRNLWGW